ncbi:hypothetical protein [Bacillus sp. OTU2372]|uniref:hypothetical protein n=1 Tax=Bacillus sp. OTU2372 TaxID=3043858 RepID=UPI00313E5652
MKDKLEYRENWKRFIIFTLLVGLNVGIFSVISDNLPDLNNGVTVFEFIISYLAVMTNSLPIWFIVAMFVGYLFADNIKDASILGAIYTISAITYYFVIGHFYTDSAISVSLKEQAVTYATWYGASAIGGILGGIVGYLIKKTPFSLLTLLLGLFLQLFVNGKSSWSDIVGIAQNITYYVMIVSIIIYIGIEKRKMKEDHSLDCEEM